MKGILIILVALLLTSCQKVENQGALDCIKNDTCGIKESYFTKIGEWQENEENQYSIEYKSNLEDTVVFTFDFNEKTVVTTVENGTDYNITAIYDWENHKGSYTTDEGTIVIDGESHQKILDESNHENISDYKGSDVWDQLHSLTIAPFKETPLYPFELE